MNRRWIFAGLFLLTLGAIAAIAFWAPGHDWERRDHRIETVQLVDTEGNAIEGGATIIVERGRHGFPFGLLLIPLGLFLIFGFLRGGPWRPGDRDHNHWLDEWHARQHRDMAQAGPSKPTDPS